MFSGGTCPEMDYSSVSMIDLEHVFCPLWKMLRWQKSKAIIDFTSAQTLTIKQQNK